MNVNMLYRTGSWVANADVWATWDSTKRVLKIYLVNYINTGDTANCRIDVSYIIPFRQFGRLVLGLGSSSSSCSSSWRGRSIPASSSFTCSFHAAKEFWELFDYWIWFNFNL